MIAFSGSVEGNSGIETNPAPSCLRLLRPVGLVRRDPFERLVSGDEPVPVVIGELRPVTCGEVADVPFTLIALYWLDCAVAEDFRAAKPQTLQ